MEKNARVVALGHAIVDVLATTDDAEVGALGLEKGTMALVDGERAEELYAAIRPHTQMSGGSAANTAACLASLGEAVRFVGKVADDPLGKVFAEDIRAAGVVFDTPPALGGPGTGRCLVLVTPDAEKTMCTDLGAGATIEPSELHTDAIAAADVLYIEGYLCGPPGTTPTVAEAIEVARRSGTRVAFSASDPGWVALQRDQLVAVLDRVDILFANEPEALGLSGQGDLEAAVADLVGRVPMVAVTLGANGCLVATAAGERTHVPAAPVAQVVDSTGAGDSFAAGFLYGTVNGLAPDASARLGALAAAEIVGHLGARPAADLRELAVAAGLIPPGAG
jgi:sugar/nucleoside kinase (ribokinase family)